jgi:membrane protease YdiL (CAAX protease family)
MDTPRKSFFGPVADQLRGWDLQATVACLTTCGVLIVGNYQGETGSFGVFFPHASGRFQDIYPFLWWFGCSFVLFLVVPLGVAAVTPGVRVGELGHGPGDWRFGLKASALLLGIMIPIVFVASTTQEFRGHYPLCGSATKDRAHFVLYELAYAAYFLGWESLYRGYLLFSLERRIGTLAIVVQTVPFALLHLGKPEPEAFGSVVAGLALGTVALRARSWWYGALIHIAVAVTMDLRAGFPKFH